MTTSTHERNGTNLHGWRDHYGEQSIYEVDGQPMSAAEVAKNGLGHTVRLASLPDPTPNEGLSVTDPRVEAAAEVGNFNVIG